MPANDRREGSALPLPTALGWKAVAFYLAMVGASYAAPYNNLFFLLLCYLGVLLTLSAFWTRRQLGGVEAELRPPLPLPAELGGEVEVRVAVTGRERPGLLLVLELEDRTRHELRLPERNGVYSARLRLVGLRRGVHGVRRTYLESRFPVGLFRIRRAVAGPTELVVHPRPAELDTAPDGATRVAGLEGVLGGTTGLQPSGLRPFRAGDEPRQVHWRASAKRGDLVVREWEGDEGAGAELLLDRRTDAPTFERCLSVATTVALRCAEDERPLTFHTQGLTATYGGAGRPPATLLRELAELDALPADAPAPPPVSPCVVRLPAALEPSS